MEILITVLVILGGLYLLFAFLSAVLVPLAIAAFLLWALFNAPPTLTAIIIVGGLIWLAFNVFG